jgi:hypothetical protein
MFTGLGLRNNISPTGDGGCAQIYGILDSVRVSGNPILILIIASGLTKAFISQDLFFPRTISRFYLSFFFL